MSMDRCHYCNDAIDTDFDLECYGPDDKPVCQSCREYRGIDRDREYLQFALDQEARGDEPGMEINT